MGWLGDGTSVIKNIETSGIFNDVNNDNIHDVNNDNIQTLRFLKKIYLYLMIGQFYAVNKTITKKLTGF